MDIYSWYKICVHLFKFSVIEVYNFEQKNDQ